MALLDSTRLLLNFPVLLRGCPGDAYLLWKFPFAAIKTAPPPVGAPEQKKTTGACSPAWLIFAQVTRKAED
jgi:hypothetical protein